MAPSSFERTSRLDASAEEVWARVITPEGINAEMKPFMRMTIPRGIESLDPGSVTLGEKLGRSWILLFGVLPIEYDDLTLVELEPGRRFLERSQLGSMRLWEHERIVEPASGGGCTLTDRLTMQPRIHVPGFLVVPMIRWFFGHRHRQLRSQFGGRAG